MEDDNECLPVSVDTLRQSSAISSQNERTADSEMAKETPNTDIKSHSCDIEAPQQSDKDTRITNGQVCVHEEGIDRSQEDKGSKSCESDVKSHEDGANESCENDGKSHGKEVDSGDQSCEKLSEDSEGDGGRSTESCEGGDERRVRADGGHAAKQSDDPPPPPPPPPAETPIANSEDSAQSHPPITLVGSDNSLRELPPTVEILRRVDENERSESQTSFVNEDALNDPESPTYKADRNLEQFSEILLDSDPSHSEEEGEGGTGNSVEKEEVEGRGGEAECETNGLKKKNVKKVRFADEVPGGNRSHPSTSPSSPHPGIPSPTSPRQKVVGPQYSVDELINGVEVSAEYLGSTPIILDGIGAMKGARMFQAQQAVKLIKDPESESRPRFAVKINISTSAVKIIDSKANVDLMDHPLHTITYVADIENVLVMMAHIRPPPLAPPSSSSSTSSSSSSSEETAGGTGNNDTPAKYIPKLTCHVLDTANARGTAMAIGQAFSAAYKQFLKSSGISEEHMEQAEYAHILNAQSVPKLEVESLGDRNKIKKLTLAKHKNDIMGMMVMESGYGSAIPACVIVHLSKTGSACKSGLLNVGDHILSINGVNLVGMPRKLCNEQIKKCRYMNVVKMEVCSCPAAVDVTIVRPDLKFQLGFSVHEGMICSLVRGSIAERSGVRVGYRIIDINGTSTVNMQHSNIVHLLSSTVGDLHIRMMPDIMYRLLTGKLQPDYC